MEDKRPSVLLIAESARGSSYLASRLDKRGCVCSFALSCRGGTFLILRDRKFDLVLSPTSLRDGTLYSIMNLLKGSDTTVFYSHPVDEDAGGCLLFCAVKSALDRLRFARANSFLYSTKPSRTFRVMPLPTPESRLLPVFRADVFVMSPLRSRAEFAAVNPARLEKQELAKHKAAR